MCSTSLHTLAQRRHLIHLSQLLSGHGMDCSCTLYLTLAVVGRVGCAITGIAGGTWGWHGRKKRQWEWCWRPPRQRQQPQHQNKHENNTENHLENNEGNNDTDADDDDTNNDDQHAICSFRGCEAEKVRIGIPKSKQRNPMLRSGYSYSNILPLVQNKDFSMISNWIIMNYLHLFLSISVNGSVPAK